MVKVSRSAFAAIGALGLVVAGAGLDRYALPPVRPDPAVLAIAQQGAAADAARAQAAAAAARCAAAAASMARVAETDRRWPGFVAWVASEGTVARTLFELNGNLACPVAQDFKGLPACIFKRPIFPDASSRSTLFPR